jgi:hypothetical protein
MLFDHPFCVLSGKSFVDQRRRNNLKKIAPIVLLCLLPIAACGAVSRDEVAKVQSPDGLVEAVLIETNAGATTSFGYEVHLRTRGKDDGQEVARLYGAIRNANAYGANLRWASDNELVVEYLEARDEKLERSTVNVAGRDIRVVLGSGVTDPKAPSGGMLYNLERSRQGGSR